MKSASLRLSAAGSTLLLLVACDSRPPLQSLKNEPSTFEVQADAPASHMNVAGAPGSADTVTPESSFGPSQGASSLFRKAEVPAAKLARVTALLSELGARQAADQSIVVHLPSAILFDFDKASLRAEAQPSLRKAAELIDGYPDAPIRVNGYTDSKGSDAYNDPLSRRRAEAVADWLTKHGGRVVAVSGFGERAPSVAETRSDGSDDPEARQRNRRVELVIAPLGSKNPQAGE